MKLSDLHEATPLSIAIQSGIGKNYFAARKPMLGKQKPQAETAASGQGTLNAGYGLGGGNYGAQIAPGSRLDHYFGGKFGS